MPTPKLSKDARDFIEKLQHKQAKQVLLKISDLCRNPEPPDSAPLKNSPEGFRRATIGEFRIIYRVAEDSLEILLIGKRNGDEIYRQFSRK